MGHIGRHISNELEAVEGKNDHEINMKRQMILSRYFDEGTAPKQVFADPALIFSKK